MTEELLHFIWRFRLFDQNNIYSIDGDQVRIIQVGQYNRNAGPDFEFSRIQIGETVWSGQVEIHIFESDWTLHKHHLDAHYDNTILHVVWKSSYQRISRLDGTTIPTLVLEELIDENTLCRYDELMNNLNWIPCEKQLPFVDELTIRGWLSRLAVSRLEQKYNAIMVLLEKTNYDWERTFLVTLVRAFGAKVNADAFEALALRLNLQILQKYKDNSKKIESILFGQAGFLSKAQDEYSLSLQEEYIYLKNLHLLEEIEQTTWRFLRMRPYNFPTYRLGQLAALLHANTYWFSFIGGSNELKVIFDRLDSIEMNSYWTDHYRFGMLSPVHSTKWSLSFKEHLSINCFIPILFAFGAYMEEEKYTEKALNWLNELPVEKHQITQRFKQLNVSCHNAADSQALLMLKNQYCEEKKCLSCAIGLAIFKR